LIEGGAAFLLTHPEGHNLARQTQAGIGPSIELVGGKRLKDVPGAYSDSCRSMKNSRFVIPALP